MNIIIPITFTGCKIGEYYEDIKSMCKILFLIKQYRIQTTF